MFGKFYGIRACANTHHISTDELGEIMAADKHILPFLGHMRGHWIIFFDFLFDLGYRHVADLGSVLLYVFG